MVNPPSRLLSACPNLFVWSALGGALLLGTFLRLYQLDYKSLWVDEILQVLVARNGIPGVLEHARRHVMGAPPLDYLVTAVTHTLGESEFILRFPPVAWGILTIALSFALARRLTGSRTTAFIAAALVAAAPLLVRFAQEVRFYSLPITLALLMVYLFVRAWREPSTWRWVLFSLATLAACFAHYYSLIVLGGLGGAALLDTLPLFNDRPRNLPRAWVGFIAALLLPSLALAVWFRSQGLTGPGAFPFMPPTLVDLFIEPVFGPLVAVPAQRTILFAVGGILFPLLALLSVFRSIQRRQVWGLLLALIVGLGMSGVVLADWRASYFYTSRQLLFIVPFYLILVAGGLVETMRLVLRRTAWATAGAVLALSSVLVLFSFCLRVGYDSPKQDWRGVAEFVGENFSGASNLVISAPGGLKPYLFFYDPLLEQHFVAEAKLPALAATQRVWFVTLGTRVPRTPKELTAAQGWHSVQFAVSPDVGLAYMGRASPPQLQRELAQLYLSPRALVYSNYLQQLDALDPTLAQQVVTRTMQATQELRPPLLDGQQARLLRKINALK